MWYVDRGEVCGCGDEVFFFFQAEDGIRDAQESRGLGDVYKRQAMYISALSQVQHLMEEGRDSRSRRVFLPYKVPICMGQQQ